MEFYFNNNNEIFYKTKDVNIEQINGAKCTNNKLILVNKIISIRENINLLKIKLKKRNKNFSFKLNNFFNKLPFLKGGLFGRKRYNLVYSSEDVEKIIDNLNYQLKILNEDKIIDQKEYDKLLISSSIDIDEVSSEQNDFKSSEHKYSRVLFYFTIILVSLIIFSKKK